jgi:hypothetical protein
MTSDSPITLARGALALELRPGERAGRVTLDREAAGELAALIARDLARFAPDAPLHDLAVAGALFDPVEVLRPGFPPHAELGQLLAAAPQAGESRVMAFAGAGLPAALHPDPVHAEGPLRLLPWVLRGPRASLQSVADDLEATLLDTGMAPADTALALQAAFAAPIEHARYLTAHDVAAMISMQYEHAGLAPLWPLLETALFGDDDEVATLDAPPEPFVEMRGRRARIRVPDDADVHMQRRARQLRAVLEAHGVEVMVVGAT